MTLFALSDTAIATIVTAVMSTISVIITSIMGYMLKRLDTKQIATEAKLDTVVVDVKEVKKATDGLTEKLVKAEGEAGERRGADAEKARADEIDTHVARDLTASLERTTAAAAAAVVNAVAEQAKGSATANPAAKPAPPNKKK